MDWKDRKYYAASFDWRAADYRLGILKHIPGLRLHPCRPMPKQPDEIKERGHYQYIIGVPIKSADALEYELRKAVRNDFSGRWEEILPSK